MQENITRAENKQTKTHVAHLNGGLINARSAYKHEVHIHNTITDYKLDFMAITETWFVPGCLHNTDEMIHEKFKILVKSRPHKRGGGLALIYHDSLSCTEITLEPTASFEYLLVR